MLRRSALLAVTAAATPLLVPTSFAQALEKVANLNGGQYRQRTLQYGRFSLLTSQLARSKAVDGSVKLFAGFEIAEQTNAAQVITNKQNPPPAPLNAEQQKTLNDLRQLSGKAFDTRYIAVQIDGHEQLRVYQEAYLRSPDDRNLAHIAQLVNTVIGEHLTLLSNLKSNRSLG